MSIKLFRSKLLVVSGTAACDLGRHTVYRTEMRYQYSILLT